MMKSGVTPPVVKLTALLILTVYFIHESEESHGGDTHKKYLSPKKLKFKHWINRIMSFDDESSDTDTVKEDLALMTNKLGLNASERNETILQLATDTSPIANCIKACCANSTSVNVSVLHTCNHQCVLNPHKYDTPDGNTEGDTTEIDNKVNGPEAFY